MPLRVEDCALIGGSETAALVGRDGSIDWLCWPRFGSGTCFAALLGTPEHRRWRIAPADPTPQVTRRYQDGTLVLETVFQVPVGELAFTDLMPPRDAVPRLVTGRRGQVAMELDLTIRFDYGRSMPWVTRVSDGHCTRALAGPHLGREH